MLWVGRSGQNRASWAPRLPRRTYVIPHRSRHLRLLPSRTLRTCPSEPAHFWKVSIHSFTHHSFNQQRDVYGARRGRGGRRLGGLTVWPAQLGRQCECEQCRYPLLGLQTQPRSRTVSLPGPLFSSASSHFDTGSTQAWGLSPRRGPRGSPTSLLPAALPLHSSQHRVLVPFRQGSNSPFSGGRARPGGPDWPSPPRCPADPLLPVRLRSRPCHAQSAGPRRVPSGACEAAALTGRVRRAPGTARHAVTAALVSRVPSRASPLAARSPPGQGFELGVPGGPNEDLDVFPVARPHCAAGWASGFAAQDGASSVLRPGQQWAVRKHRRGPGIQHPSLDRTVAGAPDSGTSAGSAF